MGRPHRRSSCAEYSASAPLTAALVDAAPRPTAHVHSKAYDGDLEHPRRGCGSRFSPCKRYGVAAAAFVLVAAALIVWVR
jgi:hypothetical protein